MKRITFEVTDEKKEKLKVRAAKHKSIKDYMVCLLDRHLNEEPEIIDFNGLKKKLEHDKNNLQNKITSEKNEITIENFTELFHIKGQLDLIEIIINMKEGI